MIVTNITAHKFEGKHFNSENKKKLNLEIPSQQNCCLISAPKCRHTALNEENKPKVSLTWLARCCTEQCVRLCVSVLCLLPSSTKQGWASESTKVNKTMVSPSTFGVAPVTVVEGTSLCCCQRFTMAATPHTCTSAPSRMSPGYTCGSPHLWALSRFGGFFNA